MDGLTEAYYSKYKKGTCLTYNPIKGVCCRGEVLEMEEGSGAFDGCMIFKADSADSRFFHTCSGLFNAQIGRWIVPSEDGRYRVIENINPIGIADLL